MSAPAAGAAYPLTIIGIGLGHPDHLTGAALAALREADVFLVTDKSQRRGTSVDDLAVARQRLLERVRPEGGYRILTVTDPERGDDASRGRSAYDRGVRDWHAARARAYADAIGNLPAGTRVGFLVWGDPAFYDSTIRVADRIAEVLPVTIRVLPGLSAPQVLAAEHAMVLHEIGQPVHITTGRRLLSEWSPDLGAVVVMLDGHLTCRELADREPDLQIAWGAYLGMPEQVLRRGRLADVIDELVELRAALREEHGWVMDTYVLHPPAATA